MMTMNSVIMILRTPNAFEGNAVAYVGKHPTTPAAISVHVIYDGRNQMTD